MPNDVILSHQGINGLLSALSGQCFRRIVIVDATDMGRSPGEWVRFTPADVCLGSNAQNTGGSWHGVGLAEILALVEALAVTPPELVIYGIQPLTMQRSPGLSEPVQKAVPDVYSAILAEVSEHSPLMDKGR